jgi:cellulose synthase operon protein YhjQ
MNDSRNESRIDPKSLADQSETPEDVATLYSWANLHGAKYRDFSASRAQAREETRLRAEEAAAEERRRQEEEAERVRQEEAQIAARLAAEAAEAARQAEAERLAEIARQAEAERQAVLAAQEAQRQAVQQRGWQPPPSEVYQSDYSPSFSMPAQNEPAETMQAPGHGPGRSQDFAPERDLDRRTDWSAGREADSPAFPGFPLPLQRAVSNSPLFAEPHRSSGPAQNLGHHAGQPGAAQPSPAAQTFQSPPPFEAAPSARYAANPSSASSSSSSYRDYAPPYSGPSQQRPSPVPQQDPYLSAPWQQPEQREQRELVSRPAWLAPELPPAPAVQPGNLQRPMIQHQPAAPASLYGQVPGQYSGQSTGQNAGRGQEPRSAQIFGQGSGQNPNQGPGSAPSSVPGLADDALSGSRDQIANRWYALKHVFDPNAAPAEQVPSQPPARVPVLAVFSLAGGVGKTSLVASLGRALSSRGERVLLVDTAAYGLLPFFFGARDQRPGMLRTFNPPGVSSEAPIQLVTLDPEGQPPESQDPNRGQSPEANQDWLAQEVGRYTHGANRVLIDLPTASGSTTRRVLRLGPVVLVPILPDMNSVVSVGAIEAFFRNSAAMAGVGGGKPIMPYYVLNQFDYSLPLHLDVREILREQIGDRLLPFALRRSSAVSEALAEGMTVIDYAPSAVIAEDYAHLAEWVRSLSAPATQSYRGVRWSER